MKSLKSLISGLLSAMFCMMPLTAHAENIIQTNGGYSDDGLWYYNDYGDGTVSVVCQDNTLEEVTVPAEISGKKITMLELDCFKENANLKKVILPDTITVLEDYAFYLCSALEEINIPESVEKFGFQTFYGCSSLKEISVPAGLTEIEGYTFDGCTGLEAVHVDKKNQNYKDEDGILFSKDGSDLILYPASKTGTSYTVPTGCTKLEGYAFMANPYLEEINLKIRFNNTNGVNQTPSGVSISSIKCVIIPNVIPKIIINNNDLSTLVNTILLLTRNISNNKK